MIAKSLLDFKITITLNSFLHVQYRRRVTLSNKSTLVNEGDTQQSDKPVALEFPIELEFRNVGF